ncbi:leucyl/phenylalanyl-tRNA--protein transferase [Paraglaciecola aquimarina]|uniref:Leucyl/phenylalanyl-tRNA--protein transferase n=1 Tax=Paraglaciecola algarum TaxID=3050085 RepID=A0ABS9DAU6_9ALTE|nr:leucyl/phenylalanyl-tRNA--protein transferase [Paraglaciecola sp. G1-23]MCF2950054.1 leucyl/phenylalanyl-tRNA--protein transferase [Paraglaciecola sp. G1-23]
MLTLTQLNEELTFPECHTAIVEPNGLLAFGGDLSCARLKLAYANGIFPWFSQGEPILWWSPDPRGIIRIDHYKASKSLRKFSRNCGLKISVNLAFNQVIDACASIPRNDSGTWITDEMIQAYKNLHLEGHAHSIEIWDEDQLVGGLYGVVSGKVFCGESMFHKVANSSKLAFWHLIEIVKSSGATFIDCQMQNPHLASLGCIEVSREYFLEQLAIQQQSTFANHLWQPRYLQALK